jgi:hypothetical protein
MLMIWDLNPGSNNTPDSQLPPRSLNSQGPTPPPQPHVRPQPTAYVIAFSRPLMTVNSHISTSKEFLVSDSHGYVYIVDWCSEPLDSSGEAQEGQGQRDESWHLPILVELVDPQAHSDASTYHSVQWSGSTAWRNDSSDMYVHHSTESAG